LKTPVAANDPFIGWLGDAHMFWLTARGRPARMFTTRAGGTPALQGWLAGGVLAMFCFSPANAGPTGTEFNCAGPFGRDASHAGLVQAFGAPNVSHEDVFVAGDTIPMTVVFPKDPERRLMVHWLDDNGRRGLGSVIIRSPAWSVGGASVGMAIADVQRLNGRPFKLMDFLGSDNDGQVLDWQDGKLDPARPGGCRIGAVFGINDSDNDAVQGASHPDGFLSEDPALRTADPRLYELTVYFPGADGGK
jgi:hypothetical protein